MTDALQAITGLVTSITAAVGLIFLWLQVRHARRSVEQIEKNRTAEMRPYLAVLLEKKEKAGEPAVFITFSNFGRTPAANVKLGFETSRAWHYVKKADYPFTQKLGISALVPGESRTYFLGRLVPGSSFAELEDKPIEVHLSYGSLIQGEVFESHMTLSLNDGRLAVSR